MPAYLLKFNDPMFRIMASAKASMLSFVMDSIRNEQVGRHVHRHAIMVVSSGHHSNQLGESRFGLEGIARQSLTFNSLRDEIDILIRVSHDLRRH